MMLDNTRHNSFKIKIIEVPPTNQLVIEGIIFSGIRYLDIIVDGVSLLSRNEFEGTFPVLSGLLKSMGRSGKYLLFTSVSGIADDAGWQLVDVVVSKGNVYWHIIRDDHALDFQFKEDAYNREILATQLSLDLVDHLWCSNHVSSFRLNEIGDEIHPSTSSAMLDLLVSIRQKVELTVKR